MATSERTIYEARLDARYAICLHQLHRRLYRRVRVCIAIVVLAAGSTALTPLTTGRPGVLTAMAVVVAFATFLDVLVDFAGKAAERTLVISQYHELLIGDRSLAEFDAAMERIRAQSPGTAIDALRIVAFNENARSSGHEDWVRPESRWQRLWRAMA